MLVKNFRKSKKLVYDLMRERSTDVSGRLLSVVREIMKKRQAILDLAKTRHTPFYLFDRKELQKNILEFKSEFHKHIHNYHAYYAVKSNHYPGVLKEVVKNGLGLDVSSGRELQLALATKAKHIIFSGPGKTPEELKLAIKHRHKVIIQMDSFGELERLGNLLKKGEKISVGIRVHTKLHGSWRKFGIDLKELARFWQLAKKYPRIKLEGIQCHMSLNETEKPYHDLIKILGKYLRYNFSKEQLAEIKFIDLGGGFMPRLVDGYYPWDMPQGDVIKSAADFYHQNPNFTAKYYINMPATLKDYVETISWSIKRYLKPLVNCQYFFEPGRIISTKAMHLVMKVVDVKDDDMVILDGGINMAGWEYYQTNYYPVINLTHPAQKEIKVLLQGTLCLPEDFWGYYCYAKSMKENDIIIIPNQGAYTYAWAQDFIKPIPKVYNL
jgi:diaminopimelate decarboxylase